MELVNQLEFSEGSYLLPEFKMGLDGSMFLAIDKVTPQRAHYLELYHFTGADWTYVNTYTREDSSEAYCLQSSLHGLVLGVRPADLFADSEPEGFEFTFLEGIHKGRVLHIQGYTFEGFWGEDQYLYCEERNGPVICKDFDGNTLWTSDFFNSSSCFLVSKNESHLLFYDADRIEVHVFTTKGRLLYTLKPDGLLPSNYGYLLSAKAMGDGCYMVQGFCDNYYAFKRFLFKEDRISSTEVMFKLEGPTYDQILEDYEEYSSDRVLILSFRNQTEGPGVTMDCTLVQLDSLQKTVHLFSYHASQPSGKIKWIDSQYFFFWRDRTIYLYSTEGKRISQTRIKKCPFCIANNGKYVQIMTFNRNPKTGIADYAIYSYRLELPPKTHKTQGDGSLS